MTHVLWLGDARAAQHDLAGGKGANLARLASAGFRVPLGFVVTADAYRDFLAGSGLAGRIADLLRAGGHESADGLNTLTASVRELITATALPPDLQQLVTHHYQRLGPGCAVAVRSSGVAEDLAGASFAGLHDTFLDVRGTDAVIRAVKDCWASLWTARATAYRDRQGFAHLDCPIAVVVQTLARADVAGVMFTANPMSAVTDELVINSSWGLGEAVVQGIATPDEFVVQAGTIRILERALGAKQVRVVRDPARASGTMVEDVPDELRGRLSLTDDEVRQLAALGREVQDSYDGFPQDIEWALVGGEFQLLQARPITGVEFSWDAEVTASVPGPPDEPEQVWTRAWADEAWNGAVTPLMFSWRAYAWSLGQDHGVTTWGFAELTSPHLRLFTYYKGVPYYSVELDRKIIEASCPAPFRQMGGLYRLPNDCHTEVLRAPFGWADLAKIYARIHLLTPHEGLPWHKYLKIDYMNSRTEEFDGLDDDALRQLSNNELKAYVQRHVVREGTYYNIIFTGLMIHFRDSYALLGMLVDQWYDGPNRNLLTELLTGSAEETATSSENRELWQLSERLRASPILMDRFRRYEGAEFFRSLKGDPDGDAFLTEYERFRLAHGHRGHSDRDIYFARRAEDPSIDYRAFKTLLSTGAHTDPAIAEDDLRRRRETALGEAAGNVRRKPFGGIKVEILKTLVSYVHKNIAARDNERHFTDRSTYAIKRAFLEVNRRVRGAGLLDAERDFYFLTMQELFDLVDGRGQLELCRAKIAARSRNFDRVADREVAMPLYIQRGRPVDLDIADDDDEPGALRGVANSSGKVIGRARIVKSLDEIGRVQPGDILVTNATDPGWTPVFLVISGIVLETGGRLSHGALLAREYGLPAVQVDAAMHRVPDGAQIQVDGDRGVVTILQPEVSDEFVCEGAG